MVVSVGSGGVGESLGVSLGDSESVGSVVGVFVGFLVGDELCVGGSSLLGLLPDGVSDPGLVPGSEVSGDGLSLADGELEEDADGVPERSSSVLAPVAGSSAGFVSRQAVVAVVLVRRLFGGDVLPVRVLASRGGPQGHHGAEHGREQCARAHRDEIASGAPEHPQAPAGRGVGRRGLTGHQGRGGLGPGEEGLGRRDSAGR